MVILHRENYSPVSGSFFSMVPIVLEIRHCSYRIFIFARQMYAEWIGPSGLIRELDKVDGLLDIHLRFLLGVHQQVSGLTLPFFFFPLGLIVQITITM